MRNGDSYIGPDPNATVPPYWQISADGFESGDFSNWGSAETDSGDLDVTTGAALYGTYGMQATVDDGNEIFVHDNAPLHEEDYMARFYFDPNSISIPSGYSMGLLRATDTTEGDALEVRLRKEQGEYQVKAVVYDNTQTPTETSWYTVSDEAHMVEVEWLAANDGYGDTKQQVPGETWYTQLHQRLKCTDRSGATVASTGGA